MEQSRLMYVEEQKGSIFFFFFSFLLPSLMCIATVGESIRQRSVPSCIRLADPPACIVFERN